MPLLPAAIGIIWNADHTHILLVKRKDVPIWVLPGGGIEPTETVEYALKREILEETGMTVKILRQCAHYTPINRLSTFTSLFFCEVEKGTLTVSNETAEVKFYAISDLPPLFFPFHRLWLQECLLTTDLINRPLIEISYWAFMRYSIKYPKLIIRYLWTRLGH